MYYINASSTRPTSILRLFAGLILTARTEAQVATYEPPRPSTASSITSVTSSHLANLIEPLIAAIDEETTYPEDVFQATVCLGWIHWELRDFTLAATQMPKDIAAFIAEEDEASPKSSIPTWVHVCAMKGAYIKGTPPCIACLEVCSTKTGFALEKAQEKTITGSNDALDIYKSMIPFLSSLPISLGSYSPEFRVWTERMLSRMVAVSMKFSPLGAWVDFESMLQMFHLWMSLFRFTPSNPKLPIAYEPPQKSPPLVELGLEVDYSRWDVWMSYYDTLSEILRRGYIYSPAYTEGIPDILQSREGLSDDEFITVRLQQRAEIKKVENSIEAKLLDETRFPKSNERNSRVERWVDAVMQNWRIMCGPTWQDAELGAGGKNAIARGVLDVSVTCLSCSLLPY
jgi:hypothetical protein